jgi:hypothetical protein
LGNELLSPIFFECDVVLLCKVHRFFELPHADHDFYSFFVLCVLQKEADAGLHDFWVVAIPDTC